MVPKGKRKRMSRSVTKRAAGKPASKVTRITYATLTITPKDDQAYEKSVELVRGKLGVHLSMLVNGEEWAGTGEELAHASPVDTRVVVSYYAKGRSDDAKAAIDAARDAYPKWSATPYRERIRILRRAADLVSERRYDFAAWMAFEVGKNRAESLAEVSESAELIRYYCDQMELNKGFVKPMESPGSGQETESVLRPYGVWAVIAPWNFPLALATGMTTGALAGGNAVVFKPSSESPMLGYQLAKALIDAGIPNGAVNFVTGPGGSVGAELQSNPHVDGMVFTGSKAVGVNLYHNFAKDYPKPVITEMGGKNPAIVTAKADLDQAAEGVMRAAFGFGGQKCSACSRVYVEDSVKDRFLRLLKEHTQRTVTTGQPIRKDTFMGPIINQAAVDTFAQAADEARRDGGSFVHGGQVLKEGEFAHGYFVEPTIVNGLEKSHRLFKDELFVPFLVVAGVSSFEEAMGFANETEYGLCAGIYSKDAKEVQRFFEGISAGVTYANRRAGATTGAWPGINSFGGWKGSGSTGKSGLGPYYVQQFMREQSRWHVRKW